MQQQQEDNIAKSVAVIGGGPCGIMAAKCLIDEGLIPVIFEQSDKIGGQWNQKGGNSGMWDDLMANSPKGLNNLSEHSLPKQSEMFTSCYRYQQFLEQYMEKFDLNKNLKLNCTVNNVQRIETNDTNNKNVKNFYQITYKNAKDEEQIQNFQFLIMATGRYNTPYIPEKKGLEHFKGIVEHAFNFKKVQNQLKLTKKVIVVGNGISATEICQLLVQQGNSVISSVRSGYRYVVPKIVANYPIQYQFFNQHNTDLENYAPQRLFQIYEQFKTQHLGNFEDVGGRQRDPNIFKAGVTIGQHYASQLSEGKIQEKGGFQSINENGSIIFEDGTIETGVDAIIFCTGYKLNIDILDQKLQKQLIFDERATDQNCKKWLNLWQHCFHPEFTDSFAVLGLLLITGTGFTPLELSARAVAMVFAGKKNIPDQKQINQDQIEYKKWAQKAQYLYPQNMTYQLSSFIGCRPDYSKHPEIAKALYFGPNFSEMFRIDGYGKSENGYESYINSLKNNNIPIKVGDMQLSKSQEENMKEILRVKPENREIQTLQQIFKF